VPSVIASSAATSYDPTMPVEIVRRGAGKKFPTRKLKSIAVRILDILKEKEAELSVALVGNTEIQRLNAQYRKKDYPTDVLSFPVEDRLLMGEQLLGDVIISVPKARQQAKERQRTLDEEMLTLLIHGVVHLLGYDHERSVKDERIMTRLEKKIYRALCDQAVI
jgi:probable rRNA maturation factor